MPLTQQQIGIRVINARDSAHLNQLELAEKTGINKSVLNRIEKGSRPARDTELASIAKATNVSVDYLVGNTETKKYYELSNKEKIDIANVAEQMLSGMSTDASVNFYGEPMTDEQKESMRDIIEMGLRINKEKAKRDFTPKKYRNNKDNGGE